MLKIIDVVYLYSSRSKLNLDIKRKNIAETSYAQKCVYDYHTAISSIGISQKAGHTCIKPYFQIMPDKRLDNLSEL